MIVVDTSALVAVITAEPGHEPLLPPLLTHRASRIGAPTLVETAMVLVGRGGPEMRTVLERVVTEYELSVIPFEREHYVVAVEAFRQFGKGRHPARLNFGDCLTYAVARVAGAPLLCVGEDFARTDLDLVG